MDKGVRFTGNCTMAKVSADESTGAHLGSRAQDGAEN